ncbi:MAG: hypothetical protein M3R51_05875 [Candidatus Eremiobacteraeota bacterium]|nr:hypothetical protein [Candidatus Eremiobacteraeota bacterium]
MRPYGLGDTQPGTPGALPAQLREAPNSSLSASLFDQFVALLESMVVTEYHHFSFFTNLPYEVFAFRAIS